MDVRLEYIAFNAQDIFAACFICWYRKHSHNLSRWGDPGNATSKGYQIHQDTGDRTQPLLKTIHLHHILSEFNIFSLTPNQQITPCYFGKPVKCTPGIGLCHTQPLRSWKKMKKRSEGDLATKEKDQIEYFQSCPVKGNRSSSQINVGLVPNTGRWK